MEYKKYIRKTSVCLECGDQIRYGRTDKKFCCEDCKVKHYNDRMKASRSFRNKVIAIINRNYEVLDALLKGGVDSADLVDLMAMGFVPGAVTSYKRSGKHDVFTCYDIKYIMTSTKVCSVMKINNLSVNLQVGMRIKDQSNK
jgi:hypothetical protein